MAVSHRYSYQKYKFKNNWRPVKGSRVFVAPKIKYSFNPLINLSPKFWGNVGIVIFALTLYWLIFYSPLFTIREFIVEGNEQTPKEAIINSIKKNQNLFRFNVSEARAAILRVNPIISDVVIYRGIPNALKIIILENKPTLIWISGSEKYLIDDQGYVDKNITNDDFSFLPQVIDQKNVPVKIGDRIVSPGFISFLSKINENFYDQINIKISHFEVGETTFDLYTYTEANFFVKFDTTRMADKQLSDLKNILDAHRDKIKEYVDVRINGWAYYK